MPSPPLLSDSSHRLLWKIAACCVDTPPPAPGGGVTSFNGLTGDVVLTFADVVAALGCEPECVANKSNDGTFAANSAVLYPTQQASKTYADTKLALTGGVLSGDLDISTNIHLDTTGASLFNGTMDLSANFIVGVLDPVNPQDAATKAYVDTAGGAFVLKAGDTMSGDLDISTGIHLDTDGSATFGVGALQIDAVGTIGAGAAWAIGANGAGFLGGGGISWDAFGNLGVGAGPNILLNVDGSASFASGGITLNADGSGSFGSGGFAVDAAGNVLLGGGPLELNIDGSASFANGFILFNGLDGSSSFSGGVFNIDAFGVVTTSASIDMSGAARVINLLDPVNPQDAATKAYVDSAGVGVYQPLDADLTAIAALATTGFAARTAANTWALRTITGTANQVIVTNGAGVLGDPTLSLPQSIATSSTVQFGRVGIGVAATTALLQIAAGTTVAGTAPLKFTSGSLMTTAEAGAIEFLTDRFYGTITTGAVRKELALLDATLTPGSVVFAGTNGRLAQDNANFFWDDSNNRLGLGTAAPNERLEVNGNIRMPATTASVGVIKLGASTFVHAFGTQNAFFGVTAGNLALSGGEIGNSGFGFLALNALTTGSFNTAVGRLALFLLTSGQQNTAVGNGSLAACLTGGFNTGVGASSLAACTSDENTAVGYFAGNAVTTGLYNCFVGYASDVASGSGTLSACVGIGYGAKCTASNQLVIGGSTVGRDVNDSYWGQGVTRATPGGITINATGGSGSNNAGAPLKFAGGKGTGNSLGGEIQFYTSDALGSGSTLQSLTLKATLLPSGRFGLGVAAPTAILHLKAGTTAASTAPLKFTSGSLMTTAEAGAVEFLTDKFYGTITTGAARKEFTLNDAALTSGRVPFVTTNGRLLDDALLSWDNALKILTTGALTIALAGALTIPSGTNTRAGNATLVAGTVTVSNTTVTANTIVMLTRKTSGGTLGTAITYTLSAGASFTINSDSALDTSTFSYFLIERP